jgi:hypothetical protein
MINGDTYQINNEYDTQRLHGENVSLWIYGRGTYPSDLLYEIWRTLKDEDALHLMFPDYFKWPQKSSFDQRMDLGKFVQLATDWGENACLLVAQHKAKDFAGYILFTDLLPGYDGKVHVFFKRRYWGKIAREGTALAYDFAKNCLRLKRLWDFVCWHHAVRIAQDFGFKEVAVLPKFQTVNGKEYDMHVLVLEFEGGA